LRDESCLESGKVPSPVECLHLKYMGGRRPKFFGKLAESDHGAQEASQRGQSIADVVSACCAIRI
jgi:hypothetical protein